MQQLPKSPSAALIKPNAQPGTWKETYIYLIRRHWPLYSTEFFSSEFWKDQRLKLFNIPQKLIFFVFSFFFVSGWVGGRGKHKYGGRVPLSPSQQLRLEVKLMSFTMQSQFQLITQFRGLVGHIWRKLIWIFSASFGYHNFPLPLQISILLYWKQNYLHNCKTKHWLEPF